MEVMIGVWGLNGYKTGRKMRVLRINYYRANKTLFGRSFESVRKDAIFFNYLRISADFIEELYHTTIYLIQK